MYRREKAIAEREHTAQDTTKHFQFRLWKNKSIVIKENRFHEWNILFGGYTRHEHARPIYWQASAMVDVAANRKCDGKKNEHVFFLWQIETKSSSNRIYFSLAVAIRSNAQR